MHPILAAGAAWDSWSNVAFVVPCMVPALVLLGFCIYNDARLRGEKQPVLWGVLSGVLFPAALVYLLVTRLAKPIELTCKYCGYSLSRVAHGLLLLRPPAGGAREKGQEVPPSAQGLFYSVYSAADCRLCNSVDYWHPYVLRGTCFVRV